MVLHWLNDPAAFLRNIKKCLAPHSRVIVVIPNITYYRFRIAYCFGKFPPISLSHKNFQVPREVEDLFVATDYKVEK